MMGSGKESLRSRRRAQDAELSRQILLLKHAIGGELRCQGRTPDAVRICIVAEPVPRVPGLALTASGRNDILNVRASIFVFINWRVTREAGLSGLQCDDARCPGSPGGHAAVLGEKIGYRGSVPRFGERRAGSGEEAREAVASLLGARPAEIMFSG